MTSPAETAPVRLALVTGGSRGIGRAIVTALLASGCDVAFSYRQDESSARDVVSTAGATGRRCWAVRSDAADPEGPDLLVRTVKEAWGPLDIVVANAGVPGPIGWETGTFADWQATLATNLVGPYATIRAAAPDLKARRGSAVLVSSIAGLRAYPQQVPYAASKAGLISVTRSLALALAPEVRVNAVAPGWVRTDMTSPLYASDRARAAILRRIPRARWGEPEDVAKAVVFLLSEFARFITGETLVVDGGNQLAWPMAH